VDTLCGPFGFISFVNGSDYSFDIDFIPGYLPRINVTPASYFLNVTPFNTSHLPINITNTGNARTLVYMDIVDFPSGWIIYIPSQVILEVDMSQEINLSVKPPNDFNGVDTITITFTPCMADNPTQHGEPVYLTIVVVYEP